jgi:hypothetical protein
MPASFAGCANERGSDTAAADAPNEKVGFGAAGAALCVPKEKVTAGDVDGARAVLGGVTASIAFGLEVPFRMEPEALDAMVGLGSKPARKATGARCEHGYNADNLWR